MQYPAREKSSSSSSISVSDLSISSSSESSSSLSCSNKDYLKDPMDLASGNYTQSSDAGFQVMYGYARDLWNDTEGRYWKVANPRYNAESAWGQIDCGSAILVDKLDVGTVLSTGGSSSGAMLQGFKLHASNTGLFSGEEATLLDESDIDYSSILTAPEGVINWLSFEFVNSTSYRYYRFVPTAGQSSCWVGGLRLGNCGSDSSSSSADSKSSSSVSDSINSTSSISSRSNSSSSNSSDSSVSSVSSSTSKDSKSSISSTSLTSKSSTSESSSSVSCSLNEEDMTALATFAFDYTDPYGSNNVNQIDDDDLGTYWEVTPDDDSDIWSDGYSNPLLGAFLEWRFDPEVRIRKLRMYCDDSYYPTSFKFKVKPTNIYGDPHYTLLDISPTWSSPGWLEWNFPNEYEGVYYRLYIIGASDSTARIKEVEFHECEPSSYSSSSSADSKSSLSGLCGNWGAWWGGSGGGYDDLGSPRKQSEDINGDSGGQVMLDPPRDIYWVYGGGSQGLVWDHEWRVLNPAYGTDTWVEFSSWKTWNVNKIEIKIPDRNLYELTDIKLSASDTGEFGGEQVDLHTENSIDWEHDYQGGYYKNIIFSNSVAYKYHRLYFTGGDSDKLVINYVKLQSCNNELAAFSVSKSGSSVSVSSSSVSVSQNSKSSSSYSSQDQCLVLSGNLIPYEVGDVTKTVISNSSFYITTGFASRNSSDSDIVGGALGTYLYFGKVFEDWVWPNGRLDKKEKWVQFNFDRSRYISQIVFAPPQIRDPSGWWSTNDSYPDMFEVYGSATGLFEGEEVLLTKPEPITETSGAWVHFNVNFPDSYQYIRILFTRYRFNTRDYFADAKFWDMSLAECKEDSSSSSDSISSVSSLSSYSESSSSYSISSAALIEVHRICNNTNVSTSSSSRSISSQSGQTSFWNIVEERYDG